MGNDNMEKIDLLQSKLFLLITYKAVGSCREQFFENHCKTINGTSVLKRFSLALKCLGHFALRNQFVCGSLCQSAIS